MPMLGLLGLGAGELLIILAISTEHFVGLAAGGNREGLLLPQVPVEEHWDRAQFLEEVCYKAGLPKNAWQSPDADLFRFTALVFGRSRTPSPPEPLPFRKPPTVRQRRAPMPASRRARRRARVLRIRCGGPPCARARRCGAWPGTPGRR